MVWVLYVDKVSCSMLHAEVEYEDGNGLVRGRRLDLWLKRRYTVDMFVSRLEPVRGRRRSNSVRSIDVGWSRLDVIATLYLVWSSALVAAMHCNWPGTNTFA
jgi:hypothetical protein